MFLFLVIIAGILFLGIGGWGLFWFLVQSGAVVQKALEPPTTDSRDYSLEQGREIRGEDL
ncbi:MAG: hypothetical protein WCG26_07185 [Chloroflexales bacterium]